MGTVRTHIATPMGRVLRHVAVRLLLVLVVFSVASLVEGRPAYSAGAPTSCYDRAMTQLALNTCAEQAYKVADAEMNRHYRRLLLICGKDPVYIRNLRKAQIAWLAYRDAHLATAYPEPTTRFHGSMRPMVSAQILEELTVQRTRMLKGLLAPTGPDSHPNCSR